MNVENFTPNNLCLGINIKFEMTFSINKTIGIKVINVYIYLLLDFFI